MRVRRISSSGLAASVVAVVSVLASLGIVPALLRNLGLIYASPRDNEALYAALGSENVLSTGVFSYTAWGAVGLSSAPFLWWIYRAYGRLDGYGETPPRHRAWMAPLCFFIPVLNLARPWSVMDEILRRSSSGSSQRSSPWVNVWWLTFVASLLLLVWATIVEPGLLPRAQNAVDYLIAASGPGWRKVWEGHVSGHLFTWANTQWSLLAGLTLRGVSAVALVFVISEVDTRQYQRSEQELRSGAGAGADDANADADAAGLG